MSGIVCAIRGGSASQTTIDTAIELAAETSTTIYFLYVVNLDFLSHTASSRVRTISKELHQMGEFILLTAQSRAEDSGVKAEGVVRHGNVRAEIVGLCQEIGADYAVLGQPSGDEEDEDVFTHEQLRNFSQKLEKDSGARVILVGEDQA